MSIIWFTNSEVVRTPQVCPMPSKLPKDLYTIAFARFYTSNRGCRPSSSGTVPMEANNSANLLVIEGVNALLQDFLLLKWPMRVSSPSLSTLILGVLKAPM